MANKNGNIGPAKVLKPAKFGCFDIIYRNPESLEMGDVVHGWVRINLNRTVVVHRMTVNFYGEITYRDRDETSKTQKFETRTQDLWREPKNSEKGAKLEAGVYNYDFYVGTAERELENKIVDHIKRKPLILHSAPSEELTSLSSDYLVAETGVTYVRNILDTSGCVAATAVLSKKLYEAGENLYFNVEILNCFRQLSVYVSLWQKAKVAHENQTSSTFVTHELYRKKVGTVRSSEPYKQFLGNSLWVPDSKIVPVNISKFYTEKRLVYLGTSFIVMVKPLIGNCLRVEIPIVIRNSLSRKTIIHSGATTV